ncbi:hypothetical protein L1887_04563 [Cichorium endivia]|nr:hypothetical protein L1887_04563 [Cichorium endivia]
MAEVVVCLESVLALQEKASYTLHPASMKIFGKKMPMFLLSSNGDKSVGSKRSLELYFETIGCENRILRKFEFETINVATENFSKNNKISRRGYHGFTMYKVYGRLRNGQGVSIGRRDSEFRGEIYKNEVSLLIKLEHENLLKLLGYSIEGTEVFLVYEFALYASLGRMIDAGCTLLNHYSNNPRYSLSFKQYVWTNWVEGTSSNIIDPRIHAHSSSVTRVIHIGLLCVQVDPADRPTMEEVVGMLTNCSSLTLPIPKNSISPWILPYDDYDSGAVEDFISELCAR